MHPITYAYTENNKWANGGFIDYLLLTKNNCSVDLHHKVSHYDSTNYSAASVRDESGGRVLSGERRPRLSTFFLTPRRAGELD